MIKNIIFDIGGIITDDSINVLYGLFPNENKGKLNEIYKMAYESNFNEVILGNISIIEYRNYLNNKYPDYKDYFEVIFPNESNDKNIPLFYETIETIRRLKNDGYKIYFLSNYTKDGYEFIKPIIDEFDGAVISFQVGMKKPSSEIYELALSKYNLKKEDSIYFDDRERNVIASNKIGLKSFVYTDIKNMINIIKKYRN